MKIKDTIIVINSSNRVDKVVTPTLFPDDVIEWVIAVPFDQFDKYNEKFPDKVVAIPENIAQELPAQRQWAMEYYGKTFDYIWLCDDDLQFFKRNDELLLRKSNTEEIEEMFHAMRKHLETIPMVGISTRLGNNRITEDFDEINRCTRCYAMSSKAFKEVGAVFNPIPKFCCEDFHMTLCFLEKGYSNRILHTFAQEDVGGSNADGGCSLYRTAEIQKTSSFWLSENHPSVKIKGKYSKGSWGLQELADGRNYRVDVLVGWKSAFKPRKEKVKSSGFNFMKKKQS